jgi:hypothetical protein
MSGASRSPISVRRCCAHLGLDDHGGRRREDVHQGLVPLGQVLVGAEPEGAEGAAERPVAEDDGRRDVAADARDLRRRQLHGLGELRDVRDDGRELAVEDGLAERVLLALGDAVPEEERDGGLDHLEVLGGAVEPAQERDAELQRLLRRLQELGDLLLGVRAGPAHAFLFPVAFLLP